MANDTGAFGLKPVRKLDGSPYNGATVPCYISDSYATALFVGDPVLYSPTLAEKDPSGTMPTINASAATDGLIIVGSIQGFLDNDGRESKTYNPASNERIALVSFGSDLVYHIRGDGSGAPTSVLAGQNAEMVATAAGSTYTGKSGFHLDETTPTTTQSFPLHILGIAPKQDNAIGDNAVYEVLLNTDENATGRRLGVTAA